MAYRVVSDKSHSENSLQIFFNTSNDFDSHLTPPRTFIAHSNIYLIQRLKDIVISELAKFHELDNKPHKYARVVFSYPKFNEKSVTITDWIKADSKLDMFSLAMDVLSKFGSRVDQDFHGELNKNSFMEYASYIHPDERMFTNVLESALNRGDIRICLSSSINPRKYPIIYFPRNGVKRVRRIRLM